MRRINQDVVLQSRDHAWHKQDGTAPLQAPFLAERFADSWRHRIPARQNRLRQNLIAGSVWNRDLDIMLVWREASAAVHKLFEKSRGVMLRRVDQRTARRIPSCRRDRRPRRIENRIRSRRIPYSIACERSVENLRRHAALPYLSPLRMSSTISAPNSL